LGLVKESVRLGKIAGVSVGFNWSLLVVAAFLAFGLGSGRFPAEAPGYSNGAYVIAGALTAVAFLAGVLAHEISHAVVARHEGLEVGGIVLWLMGGYTKINQDPPTPGAELRISAVGPLVSLLIGVVFGLAAFVADRLSVPHLAVVVLGWLGTINALLAGFNLLPGSPLDGGRVLHAGVWRWTGDRFRAARTASRAGAVVGAFIIAVGVGELLLAMGGDGIWLALVGWFLVMASRQEEGAAELLHSLEGVRAADVMSPPAQAPGWLTVSAFLQQYDYAGGPPAYLVQQWGGGLAGIVPLDRLRAMTPEDQWHGRAIDHAIGFDALPVFSPSETAGIVVRRLAERQAGWGLVVADGHIQGVVSIDSIARTGEGRRRQPTPVG
jgi:Zn-dependent protease